MSEQNEQNAHEYNHLAIEKKWQKEWTDKGVYKTDDTVEGKQNDMTLVEFSYPSGNLHIGHWYAFALPDVYVRYRRMLGYNTLYPMGFDSFGLPAENAAIKRGLDPRKWTYENMDSMRNQLRSMGASFDWSREIVTSDPEYYKWNQWLFTEFFKNDIAYRSETDANWCEDCKTVLANEQVESGSCERCGDTVTKKTMKGWSLRITDFADDLIDDLDALDWPQHIKDAQRNWIGRSKGSLIPFSIKEPEMFDVNTGPGGDKFRDGEPIVDRENVVIVIEHPEKDEFLCARWKQVDWQGFVTGGIEGDTIEQTVMDEVREETGYQNPEIVKIYDQSSHGLFWHVGKKQNRRANYRIVHVKLRDLEYVEPSAEEQEIAEMVWVKRDDVSDFLKREDMRYPWRVVNDVDKIAVNVFTTRADTLFGATYLVLAPENPLVKQLMVNCDNKAQVFEYIQMTQAKTERERLESKEKTGVVLSGVMATNPANGEQIPVWVADYVLAGYGTGAVMAVPAHDERDFEFAQKFDLPIKQVIRKKCGADTTQSEVDFTRKASYGIIKNNEDKYLVQYFPKKDMYSWPGGGVEGSETYNEALEREVLEETGYKILNKEKLISLDFRMHLDRIDKKMQNLCDVYYVTVDEKNKQEPKLTADEEGHEIEYLWLNSDELEQRILKTRDTIRLDSMMLGLKVLEQGAGCFGERGLLSDSEKFDGLESDDAITAITKHVGGELTNTYRLRDWSVARQRYWGTPIPVVYDPEGQPHAVPAEHLPWTLPTDVDHTPDGTAPLARSAELRKRTIDIFGEGWTPEVETFDTFVDSSWYFLRYLDPKNDQAFADPERIKKWMPVNLYMGGAEHTTMHVLYSRFWIKAMHKIGLVDFNEPYAVRINRGLILGPDGNKMSKSKGNVIDPDKQVEILGADTVRAYLGFLGPYTGANYPWNPESIAGLRRFMERVWRLQELVEPAESSLELQKALHKTIKKVGNDYGEFKFNTAISAMMVFLNTAEKSGHISTTDFEIFLKLLSPIAPHITEELWHAVGNKSFIVNQEWPIFDPGLAIDDQVTIGIQINGKMRADISVALDESEESVMERVQSMDVMEKWITGDVKKIIYKAGKILNIIVA